MRENIPTQLIPAEQGEVYQSETRTLSPKENNYLLEEQALRPVTTVMDEMDEISASAKALANQASELSNKMPELKEIVDRPLSSLVESRQDVVVEKAQAPLLVATLEYLDAKLTQNTKNSESLDKVDLIVREALPEATKNDIEARQTADIAELRRNNQKVRADADRAWKKYSEQDSGYAERAEMVGRIRAELASRGPAIDKNISVLIGLKAEFKEVRKNFKNVGDELEKVTQDLGIQERRENRTDIDEAERMKAKQEQERLRPIKSSLADRQYDLHTRTSKLEEQLVEPREQAENDKDEIRGLTGAGLDAISSGPDSQIVDSLVKYFTENSDDLNAQRMTEYKVMLNDLQKLLNESDDKRFIAEFPEKLPRMVELAYNVFGQHYENVVSFRDIVRAGFGINFFNMLDELATETFHLLEMSGVGQTATMDNSLSVHRGLLDSIRTARWYLAAERKDLLEWRSRLNNVTTELLAQGKTLQGSIALQQLIAAEVREADNFFRDNAERAQGTDNAFAEESQRTSDIYSDAKEKGDTGEKDLTDRLTAVQVNADRMKLTVATIGAHTTMEEVYARAVSVRQGSYKRAEELTAAHYESYVRLGQEALAAVQGSLEAGVRAEKEATMQIGVIKVPLIRVAGMAVSSTSQERDLFKTIGAKQLKEAARKIQDTMLGTDQPFLRRGLIAWQTFWRILIGKTTMHNDLLENQLQNDPVQHYLITTLADAKGPRIDERKAIEK